MEIAIAFTLYLSFGAYLFFPTVDAPSVFGRLAIGLCASELAASVAWLVARPGSELSVTAASAAGLQIPVLTGALLLVAAAYGVHVIRSW